MRTPGPYISCHSPLQHAVRGPKSHDQRPLRRPQDDRLLFASIIPPLLHPSTKLASSKPCDPKPRSQGDHPFHILVLPFSEPFSEVLQPVPQDGAPNLLSWSTPSPLEELHWSNYGVPSIPSLPLPPRCPTSSYAPYYPPGLTFP